MANDSDTSALQRFARDLRRIREDREVAIGALQEALQAPESQLRSFEAGTLYDQSKMTPVYLRAFVRTYAEAVGLPSEPVLDCLESARAGEYQNQLAVQYLDVPPSIAEPDPSSDLPDAASSAKSLAEEDDDDSQQGSSADPDGDAAEDAQSPVPESSPTEREQEKQRPPTDAEGSPVVPPSSSESGGSDVPPDRPSESLPKQVPTRSARATDVGEDVGEASGFWTEHRNTLLVGILGLLVIGVGGTLISTYLGDGDPAPDSPSDPSPRAGVSAEPSFPDSTVAGDSSSADTQPADRRPRADVTLGDTLYVTVLATSDVREMRVQQDDNLRRPYWIEEGDARVFPFLRRITLQNQLDSLRLLFERYSYPVSRTDDEGRIVITRDKARRFFDTLRAAPSTVPSSPDTVWGGAPSSVADSLSRSGLLPDGTRR